MNLDLPLFVYGALKTGELAHRIVEPFTVESHAAVDAYDLELLVVDGVAMARPAENKVVHGELLRFKDPEVAYKEVAKFEAVPYAYVWHVVETSAGQANALVSAVEIKSRAEKNLSWTSADDGLLGFGIPWSYARLSELRSKATATASDEEFWMAYHDLQSTFQLLWSLTERVLLFHDGLGKRDESLGEKVGWLGDMVKHQGLKEAVAAVRIEHGMGVRSNRNPDRENPVRTDKFGFPAWYEMRNNVVHRGKGTRVERGALWTATVDLHNSLAYFLQHNSDSIEKLWRKLTSADGVAYPTWLYKIQK